MIITHIPIRPDITHTHTLEPSIVVLRRLDVQSEDIPVLTRVDSGAGLDEFVERLGLGGEQLRGREDGGVGPR